METAVKLWQGLDNEISTMDEEAFQPPNKLEPREHQLLVINQGLRKMYALSKGYQQRTEQFVIDFKWASDDEKSNIWPNGVELMDKTELLQKMFWAAVKDEYSVWHEKSLGIRRGWILVCVPMDDTSSALKAFIGMLGGPEL